MLIFPLAHNTQLHIKIQHTSTAAATAEGWVVYTIFISGPSSTLFHEMYCDETQNDTLTE